MILEDPSVRQFLVGCVVGLVLGAAAGAARFVVVIVLVVAAAALTYLLVAHGVSGVEAALWGLLERAVEEKVFAAGLGVGFLTGAALGVKLAMRGGRQ